MGIHFDNYAKKVSTQLNPKMEPAVVVGTTLAAEKV